MKKIFALGIILLTLTCSLTAFAAEEFVPFAPTGEFVPGGALVPGENTASLSDEEQQLRKTAYNEILALSQTDKNILGVRLSKDSRWLFLSIADLKDKEYAKKFPQYAEFIVFTDDFNKAEEHINDIDGGNTMGAETPESPNYYLWIIGIFGIVLLGAVFIFVRGKKLIPALQTANGNVITQNAKISKKDTVFSVKQNETAPDAKVFDSILRRIDKGDE